MLARTPHYLLIAEAESDPKMPARGGHWRFVLESMHSDDHIEVSEYERSVWGERLELLSVVRGVEALEQPSKLTLVTGSAYVGKRLRKGFDAWLDRNWQWERFGELAEIKDCDLWKRLYAATQIHAVECRMWQFRSRGRTSVAANRAKTMPQDSDRWHRLDTAHSSPRKPFGPTEFQTGRAVPSSPAKTAASRRFTASGNEESPKFVPTRTGWTRVTEIDPDTDRPLLFPQAFGGSVN